MSLALLREIASVDFFSDPVPNRTKENIMMSLTHWKLSVRSPFAFLSLLACLTLTFGSMGCTKKDDDGKSTLKRRLKDDVKTLDPANAYDSVSGEVIQNIFETLYQYDFYNESYKLVPLLAADLPKISADRLTLTFRIRQDVKFQDDPCFKATAGKGRNITAQDFVYSFKRLALPALQSQGWWTVDGKILGINSFHDKLLNAKKEDVAKLFLEDIDGVKALDDYTLQIKLVKAYPQLMYILAMPFTTPLAHEAVEVHGDEKGNLTDHPVGTGPYTLKSWDHNRRLVLERNPTFHTETFPTDAALRYKQQGVLSDAGKKLPMIDRLVFEVIKESQPAWLNFMKGELDLLQLEKDNFTSAIQNSSSVTPEMASKGINLNLDVGLVFYYISFNMKDKVIGSNKALRQALSMAIDRDKWVETFASGRGRKMVNTIPPGVLDRPKTSKIKYDFNLQHAKELLKKAGFPDGKDLPVLNFDMRGADSLNRQMGEFFTQQFGEIGVKLNVIYNTFPAYLEKAKQGNLQVSYGGWQMDYPDGENVYQILYGPNKSPGPNEANFDHAEFNKLYEQIAIMEPGSKRAALYQQMDDLIQEEVPWALGYYFTDYYLSNAWLKNFRSSDVIGNKYKYLRIDAETKARYQKK